MGQSDSASEEGPKADGVTGRAFPFRQTSAGTEWPDSPSGCSELWIWGLRLNLKERILTRCDSSNNDKRDLASLHS